MMSFAADCPGCERKFLNWLSAWGHIRREHGSAPNYRDEIAAGLTSEIEDRVNLLAAVEAGSDILPQEDVKPWREDSPTAKQVHTLLRAGLPVPVMLTKGEAHDMIKALYEPEPMAEALAKRVTLLEAERALADALGSGR